MFHGVLPRAALSPRGVFRSHECSRGFGGRSAAGAAGSCNTVFWCMLSLECLLVMLRSPGVVGCGCVCWTAGSPCRGSSSYCIVGSTFAWRCWTGVDASPGNGNVAEKRECCMRLCWSGSWSLASSSPLSSSLESWSSASFGPMFRPSRSRVASGVSPGLLG